MKDFLKLKRLRKQLNLSLDQMAQVVGLDGENRKDVIKEMENGNQEIGSPIGKVMSYLDQAVPGDENTLPVFISGSDLAILAEAKESAREIIFHTRFPRFLAWSADFDEVPQGAPSVQVDMLEYLVVGMWIDDPMITPDRTEAALLQAAALMRKWNQNI